MWWAGNHFLCLCQHPVQSGKHISNDHSPFPSIFHSQGHRRTASEIERAQSIAWWDRNNTQSIWPPARAKVGPSEKRRVVSVKEVKLFKIGAAKMEVAEKLVTYVSWNPASMVHKCGQERQSRRLVSETNRCLHATSLISGQAK